MKRNLHLPPQEFQQAIRHKEHECVQEERARLFGRLFLGPVSSFPEHNERLKDSSAVSCQLNAEKFKKGKGRECLTVRHKLSGCNTVTEFSRNVA